MIPRQDYIIYKVGTIMLNGGRFINTDELGGAKGKLPSSNANRRVNWHQ